MMDHPIFLGKEIKRALQLANETDIVAYWQQILISRDSIQFSKYMSIQTPNYISQILMWQSNWRDDSISEIARNLISVVPDFLQDTIDCLYS